MVLSMSLIGFEMVIHTTLALLQLKRLKLRKHNWDSETYEFDEVLTEFASQKRVYEVVARPVVEVSIYVLVILVTNISFVCVFFWTICIMHKLLVSKSK